MAPFDCLPAGPFNFVCPQIYPDLIFNAAGLSDCARLYLPYLYLASNAYGRFEISYRRLLGRAFVRFAEPPTEALLMAIVDEYTHARLLFTWQFRDQRWGQWEISAKYLPRYKSARDKLSPEPPGKLLTEWRLKQC